jgi:uncharacterized protein (DUF697 family)
MEIANHEELAKVRRNCRRMSRNRARAAAAMAAVPLPGVSIASDVALLLQLIPAINRKFGLHAEQLEQLDSPVRIAVQRVLRKAGARFVGVAVSREMIIDALARMSVQLAAGSALKYVPIAGSIVAGTLAYHAFRAVAYAHVEDCARVVRELLVEKE